jgi:hypothetical protein
MPKFKPEMKRDKTQQYQQRDRGRIKAQAGCNIPPEQGDNTALQTTAGTFQMKEFFGWTGEHILLHPVDQRRPETSSHPLKIKKSLETAEYLSALVYLRERAIRA